VAKEKIFHHRQVDLYLCAMPNLLKQARVQMEKMLEKQIEIKHNLDITT
jgi:hypothetical protein